MVKIRAVSQILAIFAALAMFRMFLLVDPPTFQLEGAILASLLVVVSPRIESVILNVISGASLGAVVLGATRAGTSVDCEYWPGYVFMLTLLVVSSSSRGLSVIRAPTVIAASASIAFVEPVNDTSIFVFSSIFPFQILVVAMAVFLLSVVSGAKATPRSREVWFILEPSFLILFSWLAFLPFVRPGEAWPWLTTHLIPRAGIPASAAALIVAARALLFAPSIRHLSSRVATDKPGSEQGE